MKNEIIILFLFIKMNTGRIYELSAKKRTNW